LLNHPDHRRQAMFASPYTWITSEAHKTSMSQLELSPGNSLCYEHTPPSRTGGLTFVCFNALTGDKAMWTGGIGPALLAAGHGLLTYNLRGQRGSDFTPGEFSVEQIVDDACALMELTAPERPVYVGLSIGGLFGLEAHLRGGVARARGLVLINTLRVENARLEWINDAVVRAAETGGLDLLRDLFAPLLFNVEWQARNRKDFLKDGPYRPLSKNDGAYLLLAAGSTANWDQPYEKIDVPVLSVTGLQDRVFYDGHAVNQLSARIPDITRIEMNNAGHMIPAERPAELTEAILVFAAGLEVGA